MASLHCNAFVYPNHASIAWPVIQFWGSWLGTVKRERREADRKLVAACYLCDRGPNVNPDAVINPTEAVAMRRRLVGPDQPVAVQGPCCCGSLLSIESPAKACNRFLPGFEDISLRLLVETRSSLRRECRGTCDSFRRHGRRLVSNFWFYPRSEKDLNHAHPFAECRATSLEARMAMLLRVPSSRNRTGSSRRSQGLRPLA